MTLDAASTSYLKMMSDTGVAPIYESTPVQARERSAARLRRYPVGSGTPMVQVQDLSIPSMGGPLSMRMFRPSSTPVGAICYFHGGGWTVGSVDSSDHWCRRLAAATNLTVYSVEYRLAPEFPFPAAIDDAHAAVSWVLAECAPLPVVVGGDSAGGNIAAVVAQSRQTPSDSLAAQLLVCPVTDHVLDRPSYLLPENQNVISRRAMEWFWRNYEPEDDRRVDVRMSPLRALDVRGCPPAVVITAEHDVLRDEGQEYVTLLRRDGVRTWHADFEGQMHDFVVLPDMLPMSGPAVKYIAQALAIALH